MVSIPKKEIWDMAGAIKYIKFSEEYENFYECKEKTKGISRQKSIIKYLTKEVEIPTEEAAENDEDKMKIYEGNYKALNFIIQSLTDIPFSLVRQCDKNAYDAWEAFIDNYEVSYEKQ